MTKLGEFSGQWFVHSLGWTLLHFIWQGALVAILLWCVLGLLRRHSSQVRYGAACYALGLMVALPIATFAHLGLADYRAATALKNLPTDIDPAFAVQVGASTAHATWTLRMAAGLDRSVQWVFLLWIVGAVIFLVRLNVGLIAAHRMRSLTAHPAADDLQQLFARLIQRLNVQRPIQLLTSALVQVPTVIGWLRPVVLIPVSCFTGLSQVQIEAILCHELAHIRRHDYLMSVFQSVVEALLFYHPAVWWVSNQVRCERECCCDDIAVRIGGDVLAYAGALKLLEERRGFYPEVAIGVNGGVLKMRIRRLLGYTETSAASQLASIALLAIIVLAACASIGKFAYAQASSTKSTPSVSESAQPVPQPDATPASTSAAEPVRDEHQAVETQQMLERLSQIDQIGPDIQKQLQDTKKLTEQLEKQLRAGAMTEELQAKLKQQVFQTQTLSAPEQKRLAEAMQQMHDSLEKLKSPEFRKQMEEAKAAIARMNSPEFREEMEDAKKAAESAGESQKQVEAMLNSREFKKHLAEAAKAAANINTPEFRKQLEDAMREAERVNTPAFRKQLNQLLAQNEKIAQESGTPALPPARASGPIRVSGGVMAANRISGPVPIYPPDAKTAHVQGTVVLHAIISKAGTVDNLQVVSGPEALTASALDAVRQWQYKPYLLNGQPTEVETTINVNFTLAGDGAATQDEQKPDPPATTSGGVAIRISAGVAAGNLIAQVNPVYPPVAKATRIQGVVVLHAIISKAGTVENLQVVSGPQELVTSALDAVKKWTYKPYLLNGEPTAVQTTITVNYSLADPAKAQDQSGNESDANVPVRKIGGSVSAPVLTHNVIPEYTEQAKADKTGGTVLLRLVVDQNGKPTHVRVVRGLGEGLDEKAIEAVKQYKFKPAMEGGVPVPVDVRIEVNFRVF